MFLEIAHPAPRLITGQSRVFEADRQHAAATSHRTWVRFITTTNFHSKPRIVQHAHQVPRWLVGLNVIRKKLGGRNSNSTHEPRGKCPNLSHCGRVPCSQHDFMRCSNILMRCFKLPQAPAPELAGSITQLLMNQKWWDRDRSTPFHIDWVSHVCVK